MPPKKYSTIHFEDYPEFTPNLTPQEIFELGSFGGTYWRPIHSNITKKDYKNKHKKYKWAKKIPDSKMTTEWKDYDKTINKYGVKVGTTLRFWEKKGWITKYHPYGWVQWYCEFYEGKRSADDDRQVKRWEQTAGPNSRFRKWLLRMIRERGARKNDYSISPKIRQTLQHWAVKI